jgi:hypothetical protein
VPDARAPRFTLWVPALFALLVPGVASATTHRANYTPSVIEVVVANPVFNGVANTMMYTVTATVDDTYDNARHGAVVGFATRGTGPRGNPVTNCPATTDYTWSPVEQVFDTGHPKRTWTLYNFQPDTPYYYVIRTGAEGNYKYACGALSTEAAPMPTVPPTLAALNLAVDNSSDDRFTKYVMFDTDDCDPTRNYVVAIDADTGNIVWYLDIPAVTGIPAAKIGGWRFQPRGEGYLTSDRILATLSANEHRRYLYEFELDGTIVASKNFSLLETGEDGQLCDGADNRSEGPCPHHDAFKSDLTGETYVLVSENSDISTLGNRTWTTARCKNPPYRFLGDGWQTLSEDYATSYDSYLTDHLGYDPAVVPGPHAPAACATADGWRRTLSPLFNWIDWIHSNSIAGTADGEYLDLSLKEWDQIIRVRADGSSTSPEWRLASDPYHSDFGPLTLGPGVVHGAAAFGGQHDVHMIGDSTYMLFDNQGQTNAETGTGESRVLSIGFDTSEPSAWIEKSWALVDNDPTDPSALDCPTKGSGQLIPRDTTGNSVLALCHAAFAIEELNDPSGVATPPSLYIHIPEPPAEVCGGTDAASRMGVNGWYRAYPLETLGDF